MLESIVAGNYRKLARALGVNELHARASGTDGVNNKTHSTTDGWTVQDILALIRWLGSTKMNPLLFSHQRREKIYRSSGGTYAHHLLQLLLSETYITQQEFLQTFQIKI